MDEFTRLRKIVADLRGPEGCPWDKEQTHLSLVAYAIEEAYELAEAIESGLVENICEELGDFLFQVVLHAEIAEQAKTFTLDQVLEVLNAKLVRRHPHVFADARPGSLEEIWTEWNKTKQKEKKNRPIFNFPEALPALQTAQKIGRKSQTLKFFWTQTEDLIRKVEEELKEVVFEIEGSNGLTNSSGLNGAKAARLQSEVGDLLFTVAQLAQHLGVDAEQSLRGANRKFIRRFEACLQLSQKSLDDFVDLTVEEKERLWQRVKQSEI